MNITGKIKKICKTSLQKEFFSVIYLFKYKGKIKAALTIDLIISILFLLDIWYYRANGTFLSIRHILHPEIFNPIGKSLFNLRIVDLKIILSLL